MKWIPWLLVLASPALAGSGTLTIGTVSGSSPGPYTLTMTSSVAGVTVGDDLGAKLSTGRGCIYEVTAVTGGSLQLTVTDTRTSHEGAVFGPPSTGSCWYATPVPSGTTADETKLAVPPYTGVGWDAAYNLNTKLLSERVGILARGGTGSAWVSSSTSAYAAVVTVTLPADCLDTNGAAVRVTCNVRQAAGTGVNCRVSVAGTAATASTLVGKFEALCVREGSQTIRIYTTGLGATCSYSRSTVGSLTFTGTIAIALEIQGGDTAGGTGVDFYEFERLR